MTFMVLLDKYNKEAFPKLTDEQIEWLKMYEYSTGFEPMFLEELQEGEEEFEHVARYNTEWYRDWALETYRELDDTLLRNLERQFDCALEQTKKGEVDELS